MDLSRTIYQIGFQLSPIILSDGLASAIPGGMLPLICITEAAGLVQSVLNGIDLSNVDNYHAHFKPLSGLQMLNYQVANYPFANQTVAANAVIQNPTALSLQMDIPVNQEGGYLTKFLTMTALKLALEKHISLGGLFIIATPTYIYRNCLLLGLTDMTSGDSKQPQQTWRWDFQRPLVALSDATTAYSSMMKKISSGVKVPNVSWSGLSSSVGSVTSGATSSLLPSAQNNMGTVESIF